MMLRTPFASPRPAIAFADTVPVVNTVGVLRRRFAAYLVDLVVIGFLTVLFGFLIGVAGVVTFGLGWSLYAILVPGTVILYSGLTVGGPTGGTLGMRLAGLAALDADTGGRVGFLTAAVHAVLFYLATGTVVLLILDVLIGLARSDRRLAHDLLAGLIVVRRR